MSSVFQTFRTTPSRGDDQVTYAWDDWNYTDYFYFEDTAFSDRFRDVSFTGCRGFIIAIAELVAVRMDPFIDVSPTLDYLDAAWISMLEDGICDYAILSRDDWRGPFLGPLRASMLVVNDALFDAVVDGDIRARCSFAHNLLLHVLEDHQVGTYLAWLETVLKRLKRDHPNMGLQAGLFQETMPLGACCAPETFISQDLFPLGQSEKLLQQLWQRIRFTNRWLRTEPLLGVVG